MNWSRRSFLAAAGAAAAIPTMAPAQQATPKRGGTLRSIINPEPPLIITALSVQQPTHTIASKMYQGLLHYSFDLKPLPSLAKAWEISPDGKVYTFKLQDNVTWHDGAPFSADDVVFSAAEMLPETHPRWRPVSQHVQSVKALDPHAVEFTLKQPFSAFIFAFLSYGFPVMPAHLYRGKDYRNNPANATPIGTGPFKLKEWRRGSYIELVRNEHYWAPGQPYLDSIIYSVVPDSAQRAAALETGRVELVQNSDIEYFDVPRLRKLPQLEFFTKGYETTSSCSFMDINHRLPKFQDKRFRKAMMLALDRKFIVDKLYFGLGKVANGPIASTTHFYDDAALVKYPYDPKQAIALLDEMGLKPDSNGVRQRVKVLALPYGEVWNRQAELVKQQFGKVGIEVTIETTDGPGWYQRNANWDFELCFNFLGQFMHPAIGVSRAYISSNIRKGVLASNVSGYSNPKIDELFDRAAISPSEAEAQKLYSEIQHILSDDVPLVYLTELQFPTFVNRKFHDVVINAEGCYGDFGSAWMSA
jgi:peptide/nickel transport system substrate-binding protein